MSDKAEFFSMISERLPQPDLQIYEIISIWHLSGFPTLRSTRTKFIEPDSISKYTKLVNICQNCNCPSVKK